MSNEPWIGVDLDGTLAYYGPGATPATWTMAWNEIGPPIPAMLERVIAWNKKDIQVRIVTARVFPYIYGNPSFNHAFSHTKTCLVSGDRFAVSDMLLVIHQWCAKYIGHVLPVTCAKDYRMIELWDDRAVQVVPNRGTTLAEENDAVTSALHGKAQG